MPCCNKIAQVRVVTMTADVCETFPGGDENAPAGALYDVNAVLIYDVDAEIMEEVA